MQDKTSEIIIWTIIGSIATILSFIAFINHIIMLYNKKNIEFNQQLQLRNFEKEREVLKTRIDVQEETIQKISKELHDNVNQILTLAKLNLNNIDGLNKGNEKLIISRDLITNAINELSNLSSSLSSQMVKDLGLIRTLEIESSRIMTINNTQIIIENNLNDNHLNEEDQLILYRIFQEATRNAVIHGKARNIIIKLFQTYDYDFLFEIEDDGTGFNVNETNSTDQAPRINHQGLKNMQRRASILNGEFIIESSLNQGTKVVIRRNKLNQ
jgi:two-component system NarL family sensor kinase